MGKALPIFFIHRGSGNILNYVINQVKASNPESEIVLIGDESNEFVRRFGITHIMLKDYFEGAERFEKKFVNLSTNPAPYECFCFQRWFVLNEYIKSKGYTDHIVYLDTDAMVYSNLTEFKDKYLNEYDLAVCRKQGPQYTFINSIALNKFCEYIMCHYTEKTEYKKLTDYYEDRMAKGLSGGVCDMTLLGWFADKSKTFDTNIIKEGALFDNSVNRSEGFQMRRKIKKIVMENNIPYGFLISGEKVKFNGLHFQGAAKWLMYRYYTGEKKYVPSKIVAFLKHKKYQFMLIGWKIVIKLKLNSLLKRTLNIKKPQP